MGEIKYNCVFGGGGVRGLCYVGAVKALEEHNIEVDSIAGSSVGAVFAALYAVGYSYQEIKEMFLHFNFNMFMDLNINIFNTDISISKGEIFLEWLREKIELKVLGKVDKSKVVRFKDIKKDLQIHALDINTNTPYIFSKSTTPDEEIALAVRISAGLPGLMKPMSIGNALLVDGDLIKSWPAWKIYDSFNTSDKRILEFRLEGSRDGNDIKNPMDYLNTIISTIWYLSTEDVYNTYHMNDRYDFVVIDAKEVILFDFSIEKSTKEKLIEKGYSATSNYLTKILFEKKKKILSIYKRIYSNLRVSHRLINQKNPDYAISVLNEILSNMSEDIKYIDVSIYEKIKELKCLIQENIKSDFIFCKTISNIKTVKERSEYTTMLVEERINDLTEYIKVHCNKC